MINIRSWLLAFIIAVFAATPSRAQEPYPTHVVKIAGSFMDYAMPRADNLPLFEIDRNPVPTTTNPLGVKGAGECGTVGALPAVMNAINDALAPLGVRNLSMPATPERVWQAIEDSPGVRA